MVEVPSGKVLRLKKSIYGLRRAARCWGTTLAAVLRKRGFQPSVADPALYINHAASEFLGVHVDDLLFVSSEDNGFTGTGWLNAHLHHQKITVRLVHCRCVRIPGGLTWHP